MKELLTNLGYDVNNPTHILLQAENRANLTAATFTYTDMICVNRPELNTYASGAPFGQQNFVVPEGYLLEVRSIAYKSFDAPATARTDSYIGIGMSANASGSTSNSASNFATFLDDFRMLNLDPNSQSDDFNIAGELHCYPNMCNADWEGALAAVDSGSYFDVPHLRPDLAVVQRVKACWAVGTGAWSGQKAMYAFGVLKKVVA